MDRVGKRCPDEAEMKAVGRKRKPRPPLWPGAADGQGWMNEVAKEIGLEHGPAHRERAARAELTLRPEIIKQATYPIHFPGSAIVSSLAVHLAFHIEHLFAPAQRPPCRREIISDRTGPKKTMRDHDSLAFQMEMQRVVNRTGFYNFRYV